MPRLHVAWGLSYHWTGIFLRSSGLDDYKIATPYFNRPNASIAFLTGPQWESITIVVGNSLYRSCEPLDIYICAWASENGPSWHRIHLITKG